MRRIILVVCLLVGVCSTSWAETWKTLSVAGTFNNWDPAAAGGEMAVKGDHWEAKMFLHAGAVEYKFCADKAWALNWGDDAEKSDLPQKGKAVRGAGNILIRIDKSGTFLFSFDPSTGEYELVRDSAGEPPAPNPEPPTPPAPEPPAPPIPSPTGMDFREETIYFLITTRFYNGDAANDFYCRDRIKKGDPHWRGDFKGLIEQLDYIRDLGFTAIWITPPVENRSGLDYHGYHAYDWTRIDPRLESPGATYADLIKACHARGIKVIQDVVINHSSNYGIRNKVWIDRLPIKYFRKAGVSFEWPYVGNLGNYTSPWREDNDNPLAPGWFRERQTSDPEGIVPLKDPVTGVVLPTEKCDPNRFFGTDVNRLDPAWYHQNGFMAGGDWESPASLQTKHMAGDCLDLATERANVREYLNTAICGWLDLGVDAIRLDTVKHVERGDLLSYVNTWKKHKPGLFVFGENLVKGHGWGDLGGDNGPSDIRPWWYTRLGNDRRDPNSGPDSGFSVLDFSLFSTFRDNLSRGSLGGIEQVLSMDWVYGDATRLVTFLQNHDVGPDNDFKYRFKGDDWMAAVAYNLLWTIRGIPCLYYGEEIAFQKGLPQDICGNDDTLDQTGRAYFGDHLAPGAVAKTRAHPLWTHIQRLNAIRRAVPALQKAPMSLIREWGSGMSFVRDWNNGKSYAVVGLAAGSDQHITVVGIRNGLYRDAVTGNTVKVEGGSLVFDVKANSAGIYVLNGPGKIGSDGVFLR
ncbi:MAG TPA: alpha-amylase family glycosyl hydrolase [Candidatus Ozemobacteraceae bacterium]|nr:alpha-amylase family glycosyl hydrolase [Candidatus Ozemobacteraceae bacterium]